MQTANISHISRWLAERSESYPKRVENMVTLFGTQNLVHYRFGRRSQPATDNQSAQTGILEMLTPLNKWLGATLVPYEWVISI